MPDVTFTFRADAALKDAFIRKAKKQNRNASILLRDFMRQYVEDQALAEGVPSTTEPPNAVRQEVDDGH